LLSIPTPCTTNHEIQTTFWFADNGVAQKEILDLSGEPYLPLTTWALSHAKDISTGDLWKYNYERDVIRAEYHKLLKDAGIDFLLGPAFNGVAAVNGTPTYFLYTSLWNFLDKPAAILPSGLKVDQELDKVDTTYKPRNAVEEDEYSRCRRLSFWIEDVADRHRFSREVR
jgi:amidase